MKRASLLLGLAGWAVAFVACASSLETEPAPNAARCVVMNGEPLPYPKRMAQTKTGGVVRVKLTFASPTSAPRAEVFFDTVGDVFREAVLERVDTYRLPCLRPGDAPVAMSQEFVFTPDESRPVMWSPPRDEQSANGRRVNACLTGADKVPDYPRSRIDATANGVVFARYTFTAPDAAPAVEVLFDGSGGRFAETVKRYAANLRVPCMAPGDAKFSVVQNFRFTMTGTRQTLLRDVTLATFVKGLDKLEEQHVRFDFATMGCPFDVRLVLRQPVLPNQVGEVERNDPNRREFIEWLKQVSLKMPERDRAQVLGDSMTLSVPCGTLDLS